jgi:PKD repeat protein
MKHLCNLTFIALFLFSFYFSNGQINYYSLEFDGNNDYVNVNSPYSGNISNYTVEAWFLSNNTGACGGGQYKRLIGFQGYELELAVCGNNVQFYDGSKWKNTGVNVNDGRWHHIAAVKDFSNYIIYIDGNEEVNYTRNNTLNFTGSAGIGATSSGSERWKGKIDEVRMWNISRSQQDIICFQHQKLSGTEPGLAGYWPMDDGPGNSTVVDNSTGGNNGTFNGMNATTAWKSSAPAARNFSLKFDGVNDHVSVSSPLSGNINQYTAEAWFMSDNPGACGGGNYNRILGFQGYELELAVCGNNLQFYDGNVWVNTGAAVNDNQWHHVAVVRDKPDYRIYVDGALTYSYQRNNNLNFTGKFSIGATHTGSESWKGRIDEVRIWNTTRTLTEIQASKNKLLQGDEAGLVGYWPLDGDPGTTTAKDKKNLNDGTLKGFDPGTKYWSAGFPMCSGLVVGAFPCDHVIYLYNGLPNTFKKIEVVPATSSTTIVGASAGNNWITTISGGTVTWARPSGQYIPTGYPINNVFTLAVSSNNIGGQKVKINWIDDLGQIVCTKTVYTPCYLDANGNSNFYDPGMVSSFLTKNVKEEDGMLKFASKRKLRAVYNYLESVEGEDEWFVRNEESIDSLQMEPFLESLGAIHDGFKSLLVAFQDREKALEMEGEAEPLTGWAFYGDFIDDEENALLSEDKSVIVGDHIYLFATPYEYFKINNNGEGKRVYEKVLELLGNVDISPKEIAAQFGNQLALLDTDDEYLFEETITPPDPDSDPCDKVKATTGNIYRTITGEGCDFDQDVQLASQVCNDYTFKYLSIDKEDCEDCEPECSYDWTVKKRDNITNLIYLPVLGAINISPGQDLVYTFDKPGYYKVCVTEKCEGCPNGEYALENCDSIDTPDGRIWQCDTIWQTETIQETFCWEGFVDVLDADFEHEMPDPCNFFKYQFTDKSAGSPNSWEWTFQDGTPASSTNQNPLIAFSSTGNKQIKLKVTDDEGCEDVTTQYINIQDICKADFRYTYSCWDDTDRKIPVTFNNKSTGASCPGTNFIWSMGDGTNTNQSTASGTLSNNPFTHSYFPGTYTVKLVMDKTSTPPCQDDIEKTVKIKNCEPNITYDICPNGEVVLRTDIEIEEIEWTLPPEAKFEKGLEQLLYDKELPAPRIYFECPGTYHGSVKLRSKYGCVCEKDYTIQIDKSDMACCHEKDRQWYTSYFNNSLQNTGPKDKYKMRRKIVHKKSGKIKVLTKFRKRYLLAGPVALYAPKKTNEIGLSIVGTHYEDGARSSGTVCECEVPTYINYSKMMIAPPKKSKVKKKQPIGWTRTGSIITSHWVKLGSDDTGQFNITTGDWQNKENCPPCRQ